MLANRDWGDRYRQIGTLLLEFPDLVNEPITPDVQQWLGRAEALLEVIHLPDLVSFKAACSNLYKMQAHYQTTPTGKMQALVLRSAAAQQMRGLLYSSLARAELRAPPALQGSFIPAGSTFDAFAAVSRVISGTKADLLIVDPYLDATVVIDFLPVISVGVRVRLLSDERHCYSDALRSASARWLEQNAATRPLEVRLASARTLHDRVLIVDDSEVFVLTQSIKDLAKRSPAALVRMQGEAAPLKREAYSDLWKTSAPLKMLP